MSHIVGRGLGQLSIAGLASVLLLLVVDFRPATAQGVDETQLPAGVREALGARTPATPDVSLPGSELGDGPIDPATYPLGPGDELTVRYRGRTSATHAAPRRAGTQLATSSARALAQPNHR